jgi:hypothetical protein
MPVTQATTQATAFTEPEQDSDYPFLDTKDTTKSTLTPFLSESQQL